MLKSKRIFHRTFTLVELIVSMGIFSLLLLMVMNFFSGSQRLISKNGQNNDVYADARVAMELMATMLSSTYYSNDARYYIDDDGAVKADSDGGFLFSREKQTNNSSGGDCYDLYFAVRPDLNNDFFNGAKDSKDDSTVSSRTIRDVFFVRMHRGDETDSQDPNALYISYLDPNQASVNYNELFPPYSNNQGEPVAWNTAKSAIEKILNDKSKVISRKIIKNVVGLEFTFHKKTDDGLTEDTNCSSTPPAAVEVKLSLLTQAQKKEYDELSDSEKDDYIQENRKTFTRMVYIGAPRLAEEDVEEGKK